MRLYGVIWGPESRSCGDIQRRRWQENHIPRASKANQTFIRCRHGQRVQPKEGAQRVDCRTSERRLAGAREFFRILHQRHITDVEPGEVTPLCRPLGVVASSRASCCDGRGQGAGTGRTTGARGIDGRGMGSNGTTDRLNKFATL